MNQSSFRDALDVDIISCEICCEKFTVLPGERVPKMLSCSHSFCSMCINQIISTYQNSPSTIMCPTCRKTTILPKDGLSGLANNFTVLNLLDMINADIEPKPNVSDEVDIKSSGMCTNCEKNTAYFHCQQCETAFSYFCQQCAIQHNNFKVFKSHEIIAINFRASAHVDSNYRQFNPPIIHESLKDICEKHINKSKDIYCKSCQQIICDRCALSEHRSHNFADLVEYINEEKQVLKVMIDSIENYNKNINKDQYSTYLDMIQNNHHSIATEIETTFQQIQTELYQRKDQLMQQLETVAFEKKQKLVAEKQSVEDWLQRCAACVPAATTLLTLGDSHQASSPPPPQSLLQNLSSLKTDLQTLWLQLTSAPGDTNTVSMSCITATVTGSSSSSSSSSSLFTSPWGGEVSQCDTTTVPNNSTEIDSEGNSKSGGERSICNLTTTTRSLQAPGRVAISSNECNFTLWLPPDSVTNIINNIQSLGELRDKTYSIVVKFAVLRITPLVSGTSTTFPINDVSHWRNKINNNNDNINNNNCNNGNNNNNNAENRNTKSLSGQPVLLTESRTTILSRRYSMNIPPSSQVVGSPPPLPPPLPGPSHGMVVVPPRDFQSFDNNQAITLPVRYEEGPTPRYISVLIDLGLVKDTGEAVTSSGWTPVIALLAPSDATTTSSTLIPSAASASATYIPILASEYEVNIHVKSTGQYDILIKLFNCHSAIYANITLRGEPMIHNEPILLVAQNQLLWGVARGSVIQTGYKSQSKASVDNLRSVSKDTSWLSTQSKDSIDLRLCSEYCLIDRIEIWSKYMSTYRIWVKRKGEVGWKSLRATPTFVPVEYSEQWVVRVTDSERCELGPVEALRLDCCRVPGGYVSLYSLNVFGYLMNSISSSSSAISI